MADRKYLVVYKGMETAVPKSLREFVQKKIAAEFGQFDLELDFTGKRDGRDLVVTFTNEIPSLAIYGESTRVRLNDEALSGDSTVYTRMMQMMRLQIGAGSCEPAFPETEDALGTIIANVTIHETGHMLGMDTGGYDDGGHTTDKDNYMWDPGSMAGPVTRSPFFEYTVKRDDTMFGIVQSYTAGTLDRCRIGPNGLTYNDVWQYPENKKPGFVADPAKGRTQGRRANDPGSIYPGEKVALPNTNFRTQDYKHYIPGFLGQKSFTSDQIDTMKKFIAQRLTAGKG